MFEMVCEAMKKTIDENLSEPNEPTIIAKEPAQTARGMYIYRKTRTLPPWLAEEAPL